MDKGKRRVSVSGRRTILTYGYLHSAADMMLEKAEATEEGRFYYCLCSIVMNAFCLEAYLNHVGSMRSLDWGGITTPLDKLKFICKTAGIVGDMRKRPFQSMKLVNQYRNTLAHGHTEEKRFAYQEDFKPEQKVKYPSVMWESQSSLEKTKMYFEDLESVVNTLHFALGLGKYAFGILGFSEAGSTLHEPSEPSRH